jgi:hypothetical protein
MKYSFITTFFFLLLVFVAPAYVHASEITIRPFLIDETLAPRDSVQKLVTLTNDYQTRKAVVYATVNEITVDNTGEIKDFISPAMSDRTTAVTSWIEVSRGRVEIPAGETREIPMLIKVHPFAEPGEYHVFVGFVETSNRPKAEAIARAGDADGVIVKVTVADERVDGLRISSFIIDRFVTGDNRKSIEVEVENTGDIASAPTGEIIFYDSRGVERTSVPVNTEGIVIAPGEIVTLQSTIPMEDELGRYKANVSLRYGENQTATLFDTTLFYLMPFHMLMLLFAALLIVAIFVALLMRRILVDKNQDNNGDYEEVTMYVRDGHEPNPHDHDIDLKNK